MPVPTTIADLVTSTATNSPLGTEAIGTLADDYIRASAAFIRRESNKGADISSAAALTPGTDGNYFVVTGTTTITSIANSWIGRLIHLRWAGSLTITHNATSLILPGAANIQTDVGSVSVFVQEDSSGNWRCISHRTQLAGRRLIDIQVFTATGTWTRPSGTAAAEVIVLAGGDAGGGPATTAAGVTSAGSGGNSGSLAEEFITSGLGATESVTIGAGGTGVANLDGNPGGATSFGSHITAPAGTGGSGGISLAGDRTSVQPPAPVVPTTGTINTPQGLAGTGFCSQSGALGSGGNGGSSRYGTGGLGGQSGTAQAGGVGLGRGAGGGGGAHGPSQGGGTAGGAGTAGLCIVTSYTGNN